MTDRFRKLNELGIRPKNCDKQSNHIALSSTITTIKTNTTNKNRFEDSRPVTNGMKRRKQMIVKEWCKEKCRV